MCLSLELFRINDYELVLFCAITHAGVDVFVVEDLVTVLTFLNEKGQDQIGI